MTFRNLTVGLWGIILAWAPALAQDPQVDLESVDALLGGDEVAGEEPTAVAPAEGGTIAAPPPAEEAPPAPEPEPTPAPEPSDLDRAYAAYSGCTSSAGASLTEQGEALEVVGVRALAACGEERAAYVNAFYFAQLPAPEGVEERELRLRAERLVSQTDTFLIATVTEAATAARNPAPAEPAPEAGAPSE
ncbi:MAG: hypothetical protein H7X93_00760 [Sphingomonadaceae bacterium]|nr:hypothetical protein [Sphingomonadaceae bacterium]